MISSMTGFGKGEAKSGFGKIKIEIKTLNHRYFELMTRLPESLLFFEDRVRESVQRKIKRGRVNLSLVVEDHIKSRQRIKIDEQLAKRFYREIAKLKKRLPLKGDIKLDQFLSLPDIITYESSEPPPRRLWQDINKALDKALENLIKSRRREGRAISCSLGTSLEKIWKSIGKIKKRSTLTVKHYKKLLKNRVRQLVPKGKMDEGRLEMEVALYAKNCDITEEINRIQSHLDSFEDELSGGMEVGKKLDFIAQELQREINTVGSKASDFKISQQVISVKSEVEKIREQSKNIE